MVRVWFLGWVENLGGLVYFPSRHMHQWFYTTIEESVGRPYTVPGQTYKIPAKNRIRPFHGVTK